MGLSRNKVAVSEGAAGSPPFYGDTDMFSRAYRIEIGFKERRREEAHVLNRSFVVQFSVTDQRYPARVNDH